MKPKLYHVQRTISSPIVQILVELDLYKTAIEVETLSFADLKTPAHLARNPMGTSPTYEDSDLGIGIWESGAILTYLLETYDTKGRLHPTISRPKERAIFLHLQQYILATVYPFVASLYIHTLQKDQDAEYVSKGKEKWKTLLAPTLERFLGSENPYFLGDQETAVDFLVTKPLGNAHSMGLLEDFPRLESLYQKMRCRPSYAIAYGEDGPCDLCRSLVLVPGT